MLQTLQVAAEAAVADEELRLLDFIDQNPPQKPYNKMAHRAHSRNPNSLLIDELLDASVDSIPGLSPVKNSARRNELNAEAEVEEEELEWLSNKDAFPSLESSFGVLPTTSPVSVLPPPLKVPVKARSKISRKRRRIFPPIRAAAPPVEKRRCSHCETDDTPQWRLGPAGHKTLCNACGVRYAKGRLFPEYRPANSPSFVDGVHSNKTRRIMDMRMGKRPTPTPKREGGRSSAAVVPSDGNVVNVPLFDGINFS